MFTDAFGKIWYKGNLHTHTTNSDGAYTPEETIALYKSKGYDFLALTDHWFHGEGRQEENFLLLNGTEFDVGSTVQEGIYHIVGIGMEKAPALTKRAPGLSAQKIIDEIHNVNGIAILAHPHGRWIALRRSQSCTALTGARFTTLLRACRGTAVRIPVCFSTKWRFWDTICRAWRQTMHTTTRVTRRVRTSWCRRMN